MNKTNFIKNNLSRIQQFLLSVPIFIKILGIGALLSFLFGAVTLYQIQISLTPYLYQNLRQNTISMAHSLSETLIRPMITHDFFNVYQIIQDKLEDSPDISYIIVFDHEGKIIANPFEEKIPQNLLLEPFKEETSKSKFQVFKNSKGLIFDTIVPILDGEAGELRLGVSDETVIKVLSSITKSFLLKLVLCIILGQILALFLAFILTKPITQLIIATNKIRHGDFKMKAKVYSSDEIGKLAMSFNQMAEALDKYQEEVKEKEFERLSLIKKIVSAQEKERKYIALELHDHFGQYLSSLLLMIQSVYKSKEYSPENIEEIEKKVHGLIDDIHKLAYELRPSILDDYGLNSALERYFKEIMKYSNVKIDYQNTSSNNSARLPGVVEITLYRITQEAFNNILRHANAYRVSVILVRNNSEVTFLIEDDGVGFDLNILQNKHTKCLGLISMRERVTLLSGNFFIETSRGKGTTLQIKIPIEED